MGIRRETADAINKCIKQLTELARVAIHEVDTRRLLPVDALAAFTDGAKNAMGDIDDSSGFPFDDVARMLEGAADRLRMRS